MYLVWKAILNSFVEKAVIKFSAKTKIKHDKKLSLKYRFKNNLNNNLNKMIDVKSDLKLFNLDNIICKYLSTVLSPCLRLLVTFSPHFAFPIYNINFLSTFQFLKMWLIFFNHLPTKFCFNDVKKSSQVLSIKYFYNFKPLKIFLLIFTKCFSASFSQRISLWLRTKAKVSIYLTARITFQKVGQSFGFL